MRLRPKAPFAPQDCDATKIETGLPPVPSFLQNTRAEIFSIHNLVAAAAEEEVVDGMAQIPDTRSAVNESTRNCSGNAL